MSYFICFLSLFHRWRLMLLGPGILLSGFVFLGGADHVRKLLKAFSHLDEKYKRAKLSLWQSNRFDTRASKQ